LAFSLEESRNILALETFDLGMIMYL